MRMKQDAMSFVLEKSKPYQCFGIGRVWVGLKLLVFLGNPSDIEVSKVLVVILSSQVHLQKSPEYHMFKPWFGNGLLISSVYVYEWRLCDWTGDKWQAHRKLIAPTFHLNVLKSFLGQLNANSKILVERLRKEQLSGKPFDIHDYVAETTVDTLLGESRALSTCCLPGHDTVAAGTSFLACILGYKQDIQEKVVQELYEIFGDSDRPATFNDTLQMKYLERVILETLRLFPPVPVIARKVTENVKLASGYTIPAGTTCIIPQFYLHRLPSVYPNPEEFNPDNFLAENMSKRHYYSFIPFSAGPRSCVGRKYAMLKMKVMISTLFRNYRILADMPYNKFPLQADIILKRSDGFIITIEERRKMVAT
ncbi:hypothetical protein PR048_027795 [Dryococelus australis]|uniref:Cytochrome P450 n=1 Tax=Dryococelus australis TaxID=614101 RepID=A0ABQ9GHI4_9NEOP|nr:hypothetical protein PR048_027795 [Dryococelus australis]